MVAVASYRLGGVLPVLLASAILSVSMPAQASPFAWAAPGEMKREPDDRKAKSLYLDANKLIQAGLDPSTKAVVDPDKVREGIEMLEGSAEIEPLAQTFYVLGRSSGEIGDDDACVAWFDKFLERRAKWESAGGPVEFSDRGEAAARRRKDECEERIKARPAPDPVEPDPVEPDPIEPDPVDPDPIPEPKAKRWYQDGLGDGLGAAGIVIGVGGATLGIIRLTEFLKAKKINDEGTNEEYKVAYDRFPDRKWMEPVAIVAGAVGAALLAGGIVRWVMVEKKAKQQQARITPTVGPRQVGVAVRF